MSNDPYRILGVSPDATDEEVKKAYLELVRKYHPDKYAGSELADLASEKMKEINAAYEEIQRMRADGAGARAGDRGEHRRDRTGGFGAGAGNGGFGGYSQQNWNYSGEARSRFVLIRNCINSGNITEAERLLAETDANDRGAEWHFLSGCVQMYKGFYVDAQRSFDMAYRMEPTNNEYWQAKERMQSKAGVFGGYRQSSSDAACDLCTNLICADCLCECMGGDLIPCC